MQQDTSHLLMVLVLQGNWQGYDPTGPAPESVVLVRTQEDIQDRTAETWQRPENRNLRRPLRPRLPTLSTSYRDYYSTRSSLLEHPKYST
jgi:hypothetical protein